MKHLINREDYIEEYLRISNYIEIESEVKNENELLKKKLGRKLMTNLLALRKNLLLLRRLDKFTMQRLRMGHQLLSKFNIQKSVSLLVLT